MLGCAHSNRALCAPILVSPSSCFRCVRPSIKFAKHRLDVTVHAASRGGSADDPYKVLGVTPDADSNMIQRAYKQKLWDTKADPASRKKIEAAHTSIMMSALTARMKGGSTVPSGIKYADREAFMPWAPRFFRTNVKFIALVGALMAGSSIYAWIKNVSTVVTVIGVGLVGNYIKQSAINPPPRDPEQAEAEKGIVAKNLGRALMLTAFATLPAYFCVTYVPYKLVPYFPSINDFLTTPLFQDRIYFFLSTAAALFNWLMVSFYR